MLYLTCTTITSVDLAHYRVSRAKDWVSVDCGTKFGNISCLFFHFNSCSLKLLVSQNNYRGTRTFTLRYHKFEVAPYFEIARVNCAYFSLF